MERKTVKAAPADLKKYYTHKGKFLRPLLKLLGGKQKTRDIIYSRFPEDIQDKILLDLFMGSGAITIGAPGFMWYEANDVNKELINFYNMMKYYPNTMYEKIQKGVDKLHAGQKEEFLNIRDSDPEDPIERAVRIYLLNKTALNGVLRWNKSGKCNSSFCKTTKGRGWLTREWLDLVKPRLEECTFYSLDFRKALEDIGDKYFVFLDPPYQLRSKENPDGSVATYNGKKFTLQDHEDLAQLLEKANFKWLMTINDCVWTRERYKNFIIEPMEIFYSCSQTAAGRGKHKELLIRNYEK